MNVQVIESKIYFGILSSNENDRFPDPPNHGMVQLVASLSSVDVPRMMEMDFILSD